MRFWNKRKEELEYTRYEADDFYYQDEYSEPQIERKTTKRKKRKKKTEDLYYDEFEIEEDGLRSKLLQKVIIIASIYLLFIAIGAFSTPFIPNEVGKKEAHVVNIETRKNRESFNKINAQYIALKSLLFEINQIDLEFLESVEGRDNFFAMSTKYQDLLPQIDKVLPGAKAMVLDHKYTSLKNQVLEIYEDIAIYLQKMGTALSSDDMTSFNEAISWRDKAYQDFEKLRLNLMEFAKLVKINPEIFTEDLPEIFPLEI